MIHKDPWKEDHELIQYQRAHEGEKMSTSRLQLSDKELRTLLTARATIEYQDEQKERRERARQITELNGNFLLLKEGSLEYSIIALIRENPEGLHINQIIEMLIETGKYQPKGSKYHIYNHIQSVVSGLYYMLARTSKGKFKLRDAFSDKQTLQGERLSATLQLPEEPITVADLLRDVFATFIDNRIGGLKLSQISQALKWHGYSVSDKTVKKYLHASNEYNCNGKVFTSKRANESKDHANVKNA